ncbi:voltage-dependent calcium channel subunit alpha-2/delta-1 [Paramormyrops kingsleyae]|uniref:voltage-dependent calcium channel subunit alpha-2/delta-1 n=1 Tax=Paramormyrops kingsleyae TaxID=1676925 RepID=UPI003B97BD9F
MKPLRTPAALLLLCLFSASVLSVNFPGQPVIQEWVEQMQRDLLTLVEDASGLETFKEIFKDHMDKFSVKSNNAAELVASAAGNIEKLLLKRSMALKTLASSAESFQMKHQWRDDFTDDIVYYNAKDDVTSNDTSKSRIKPEFQEDPMFKRPISYNHTAVHIPTDIYEGSTIVLNELNWTEALDDVFRKNREEDPTLLWQVFGSATGLARFYPASPWIETDETPGKIDLYDVRRRPWYIQGAASPKDMLILVDASGSVSGLTLKLIRTSVSEMLETLSDDDYVNVAYFNKEVTHAACFKHLVQANVRNKKILKDAIQNIEAKGTTNYKEGFKYAFEQLSDPNVTRANCNKVIMLFTDGGEETAQEIFDKYNRDKKVRIFTFSVGQHNYDKHPIQRMACDNKGYYYEIPSIGAIRINTQEYLDVLGRPMVLADKKAKQVQWTNVYLDALELGLVITGTLPVFNKTVSGDKKKQNQLILGVMAVDVSLEDIKRLTPRFTIGPSGYYFAIDPNGYVLLHPNLQPKNLKFQEPVTLDFLDIELENNFKVQIRSKMINGSPGQQKMETLVISQDKRYIDKGVRTYTWAPVKSTDYSLALVLPDYSLNYIQAQIGDTIEEAVSWTGKYDLRVTETMDISEEYGYTLIAPREFCTEPKISGDNRQVLKNFILLTSGEVADGTTCNVSLVNRLLLDAGLTADLLQSWKSQPLKPGVLARFVATDGGITRVYPKSAGEEWTENPETYESSFYKRSLDNSVYVFTAPPYESRNASSAFDSSILVSRSVDVNIDPATLKPAVVGVKLNVTAWMENFMSATFKGNCEKNEICGCQRNAKHVDCVILDDGGFLLMSNQDEYINKIGRFFGEIDSHLMKTLVNTSLYSFHKTYDYQSVCRRERENKAAGFRSIYVPTIADILHLGWWTTTMAWSILQQLFLSLTFPGFLQAVDPEDDSSDFISKEICTMEQTQYYFNSEDKSFTGVQECANCSRMYHAEKLLNTNLIFIIVESKSICHQGCGESDTWLSQAEQQSSGPDICELAENPRDRKGPHVCFDNNVNEDYSECGGVTGLRFTFWPMALIPLVLLWILTGPGCYAS